jgi:thiol:disulfide interchange protein DsbD
MSISLQVAAPFALAGWFAVGAASSLGAEPQKRSTSKTEAAEPAAPAAKPMKVKAELLPASSVFTPGSTGRLALTFSIAKDWHMYWDGRNDTGTAPAADFKAPAGYEVGAPSTWLWPAPVRHVAPGPLLDHVYFDRLTILVPVEIPADAKPGDTVRISATPDWLVCNESCIAESAEVSTTLTISGPDAKPRPSPGVKLAEEAKARIPTALAKDVKVAMTGDTITITAPGATSLTFMPDTSCVEIDDLLNSGSRTGATLSLKLVSNDEHIGALSGILEVVRSGKPSTFYAVKVALGSLDESAAAQPKDAPPSNK